MTMAGMPSGRARPAEDLPGVVGEATSGDARFVVGVRDAPPAGVDGGERYLYASVRTPYNEMVTPAMAMTASTGDFAGELVRTLDPELGYHYGAAVDAIGDAIEIEPTLPPQTARHEGYETAFMSFDPMEVTV
jgi:hypothetical protein